MMHRSNEANEKLLKSCNICYRSKISEPYSAMKIVMETSSETIVSMTMQSRVEEASEFIILYRIAAGQNEVAEEEPFSLSR